MSPSVSNMSETTTKTGNGGDLAQDQGIMKEVKGLCNHHGSIMDCSKCVRLLFNDTDIGPGCPHFEALEENKARARISSIKWLGKGRVQDGVEVKIIFSDLGVNCIGKFEAEFCPLDCPIMGLCKITDMPDLNKVMVID